MRRKILSDEMLMQSSARAWTPPSSAEREQRAARLERASADAWTPPPPSAEERVEDPVIAQSAAAWKAPARAQASWDEPAMVREAHDSLAPWVEGDPFPSRGAQSKSSWPSRAPVGRGSRWGRPSLSVALSGLITAFVAASLAVFVNPSPHAPSVGQAVAWISSEWGRGQEAAGSLGSAMHVVQTEQSVRTGVVAVEPLRGAVTETSVQAGFDLTAEAVRLLNKGDKVGAATAAKKAMETEPSDARAYLLYGAALEELGRHAQAVQAYCECSRRATKGAVLECRALCRRH